MKLLNVILYLYHLQHDLTINFLIWLGIKKSIVVFFANVKSLSIVVGPRNVCLDLNPSIRKHPRNKNAGYVISFFANFLPISTCQIPFFYLFLYFVTGQAERTTQVSMWLKRWTGSWTKECEIRIRGWCVDGLNVDDRSTHANANNICQRQKKSKM